MITPHHCDSDVYDETSQFYPISQNWSMIRYSLYILFETSDPTHVWFLVNFKTHLLFGIQVAITRFEQIIMPMELSRESQGIRDHGVMMWSFHRSSRGPSWRGFPQFRVWLHHVNGCYRRNQSMISTEEIRAWYQDLEDKLGSEKGP